jgi:hypothetical protein
LKAFSTEIGIVFQMFVKVSLPASYTFLFQHVPVGVDVRLVHWLFIVVVYVRKALASANKLSVVVIVHDIIL